MKVRKSFSKYVLSIVLATSMVIGTPTYSLAADTANTNAGSAGYTYNNPTKPMTVDDNILTATAHRAASPVTDMLGLNTSAGFGMINGAAPSKLAEAQQKAALGIWGTNMNESPDPYYWNYFYNFYANETDGVDTVSDALINVNVAASPIQADQTLVKEYGNVSASLYTRPDIVVGCSETASGTDVSGYDSQLATINGFTKDSAYYQSGDETYAPELVSYNPTDLTTMIATVNNLASVMKKASDETGKTGRYGDPTTIAENYEKYIYGVQYYVLSKLASNPEKKKTVACLTAINEDGTFTISTASSTSNTSKTRIVEYTDLVADNLASQYAKGDEQSVNVTAEQLAKADVIVNLDNTGKALTMKEITNALGDYYNEDKLMIINTTPTTLYGLTMNSVENAMGLGYIVSYIYSDTLNMDPVEYCAYFYNKFYHVTNADSLQQVVNTNFGSTVLPENCTTTLSSSFLTTVQKQIDTGWNYYKPAATKTTQKITAKVTSKSYKATTLKTTKKTFTIGATAKGKITYKVTSGTKYVSVSSKGVVKIKKGTPKGTYKIKVTAAATTKYAKATKTITIKVK